MPIICGSYFLWLRTEWMKDGYGIIESVNYKRGGRNMSEEKETKVCKYCKSEIPKKAKVCPNCRKKQGGIGKWIVIAVIVIIVIAAISGGPR